MRIITIASLLLATMACDSEGRFTEVNHSATGAQPAAPALYVFGEHGPAVELHRPHAEAAEPSCVATCIADWQANHDACAAGPLEDGAACRVAAHEATAICLNIMCAAEREAREPGTCAASCDEEARAVGQQCVQNNGYDDRCLEEADAVFSTCWDAECRPEESFDTSELEGGPTHNAEEVAEAAEEASQEQAQQPEDELTCAEKCKAYDVAMYLKCINAPHPDVRACRDDAGYYEHICLVQHCPEGTEPAE